MPPPFRTCEIQANDTKPAGATTGADVRSSLMAHAVPIVFVVDDDISVRESLELLISNAGWQPELFETAQDFLSRQRVVVPNCLVLDVTLPGLNGIDLQKQVARERTDMPIIFITGHGDIPMTVQAMKGGAVEFLTKPFREQALLDAIQLGLEKDRFRRKEEAALGDLRARLETLSVREREVMVHVVRGRLSKQIAGELGISETTV